MKDNIIIKRSDDPKTGVKRIVLVSNEGCEIIINFAEGVDRGNKLYMNVGGCTIKKEFLGAVIEALNEVYEKVKEEGDNGR